MTSRSLWLGVVAAMLVSCRTAAPSASAPVPAAPKLPADPIERIANLEDRRTLGDGELSRLAQDPSPAIRARALLAMGRIQSVDSTGDLVRGLSDPQPQVRAMAAFGAGLIGLSWHPIPAEVRAQLVTAVTAAEARETAPAPHREELLALGRLGTAPAASLLLERASGSGDAELRGVAAVALGVAMRNKEKPPPGLVERLSPLVQPVNPVSLRDGGAYALSTSKVPEAKPALRGCAQDVDPEVRALCVKGLSDSAGDAELDLLSRALADEDGRVASEAARVLAKMIDRCALVDPCPAVERLLALQTKVTALEQGHLSEGALPLLALAQQGLAPRARNVLLTLRARLDQAQVPPELSDDVAKLDCRYAAALDRQNGALDEVRRCGLGRVSDAARLALGLREVAQSPKLSIGTHPRDVARELLRKEPQVKLAAVEALAETHSESVREDVRAQLSSPDPVLAAAAASAAAELGDTQALPLIRSLAAIVPAHPDVAQPIADALAQLKDVSAEPLLEGWLRSEETTVREAAAKALTALEGTPVVAPQVARWEAAPLPTERPQKLVIRTEKGDITVRLDWELTPRTSGNLVSLARRGYFRGVTFHRIVPDFVVQGGDPRGDGEGGPGYLIRCEVSPRPYVRGTMGMALSGKDTGGSQFFVTTSAQPHLDGRYTAFGEVISGMDVVDRLLEGDRITDVIPE